MFNRAGVSPLREFALRAHPTIPSGRSPRFRAAGGTSLRGDTPAPSSSIVAEAFATPSHPAITHVPQGRSSASAARCLVSAILLVMAVACSRPGSWEQFVKVEDAPGGVYEFALPLQASTSTATPSATTYDISFYTAPLAEPLQLEILWQLMAAKQLNISNIPEAPLQPGVERRFYESADNQTVACHSETVWFPAGEHRALYRSGVRFSADLSGNTPISLQVPPKNPLPVENNAEISTGTPKNTPTCIENGEKLYRSAVTIRVTPINPPEGFRGLGIIIKRNDGTR